MSLGYRYHRRLFRFPIKGVSGAVLIALCCAFGWLSACTAFAPKAEYRAYRHVHLATGLQDRLLAMRTYVDAYPNGRWVSEVKAAREAADAKAFEAGKDTREGLNFYLEAFPDGDFAPQARQRLNAIALIEAQRQREAEQAELAAKAQREREAEARRTWVSRFARYWMTTLAGLDNWGAPIAEVARDNPDFSKAFGRPPRPRCTTTECVKYYTAGYAIPVPGATRLERSMQVLLRLKLSDSGQLQRAELLMPGWGFSRWYEVEQQELVVDSEPKRRAAAVAWAIGKLQPLVDALGEGAPAALAGYPFPEIERPAVGPTGESADVTATDPSVPGEQVHQQGAATEAEEVSDFLSADSFRLAAEEVAAEEAAADPASDAGTPDGTAQAEAEAAQPIRPKSAEQGDAEAGRAVIEELPQAQSASSAPVTRAFVVDGMRIVLFAAGGSAGAPAYDGIVIEPARPGAR